MNWGDAIFILLSLAGVFVLLIVVIVLKSGNKPTDDNKSPPERGQ
jgi:uncharacterized protein YpmS